MLFDEKLSAILEAELSTLGTYASLQFRPGTVMMRSGKRIVADHIRILRGKNGQKYVACGIGKGVFFRRYESCSNGNLVSKLPDFGRSWYEEWTNKEFGDMRMQQFAKRWWKEFGETPLEDLPRWLQHKLEVHGGWDGFLQMQDHHKEWHRHKFFKQILTMNPANVKEIIYDE